MSAPASQRIIDLFDFLRSTGSELPIKNSECAALIRDGLELLSPMHDDEDEEARLNMAVDQLVADFDVIIEEITFREERDADHAKMHSLPAPPELIADVMEKLILDKAKPEGGSKPS